MCGPAALLPDPIWIYFANGYYSKDVVITFKIGASGVSWQYENSQLLNIMPLANWFRILWMLNYLEQNIGGYKKVCLPILVFLLYSKKTILVGRKNQYYINIIFLILVTKKKIKNKINFFKNIGYKYKSSSERFKKI